MAFKIELTEAEATEFCHLWTTGKGKKYRPVVARIADQIQSQLSSQEEKEVEQLAEELSEEGWLKKWDYNSMETKHDLRLMARYILENFEKKEAK